MGKEGWFRLSFVLSSALLLLFPQESPFDSQSKAMILPFSPARI